MREYWIIDPEPETIDVLSLVNNGYELAARVRMGEIAASRFLPGFEISAQALFRGE